MRSAPAQPPRSAPLPDPALVTKKLIVACCAAALPLDPATSNAENAKTEKRIVEFMSSSHRSSAAQPAVDRDHRSGHIIGEIGGEKLDHLGTVLDGPEAAQGDQLRAVAIAVAAARKDRLHDPPGGDDPGGDAIGGDAVGAEILRQVARVVGDRGFGRTVMRVAAVGRRRQPGYRADRDDLARALML